MSGTHASMSTGVPGTSGRERRCFPRVRGPFDGSWTGAGGAGTTRVWDLSLGGCYIDSMNDQRTGEPIHVEIALPEGRVVADGEVVYSVPNQGFALRFIAIADDTRSILARAVDRLLAEGQGV